MHRHLLLYNSKGRIYTAQEKTKNKPAPIIYLSQSFLLHQRHACLPATHLEVLSVKGQGPTDQGVQDDPQTPDVHLGAVVLLPLEELRRCVRRGAAEGVQLAARRKLVAEPKVGNLDVGVGVQEQVLRLHSRITRVLTL